MDLVRVRLLGTLRVEPGAANGADKGLVIRMISLVVGGTRLLRSENLFAELALQLPLELLAVSRAHVRLVRAHTLGGNGFSFLKCA